MKKIRFVILSIFLLSCPYFAKSFHFDDESLKEQAWNTVKKINYYAIISEDMDSLALYLHDTMVMFYAGSKERLMGKNKIVEAYRAYSKNSTTVNLEETDPLVQLYNNGNTAIVTYYFKLTIKSGKEMQFFTGKDMYILVRCNNRWYAVAQHYSF